MEATETNEIVRPMETKEQTEGTQEVQEGKETKRKKSVGFAPLPEDDLREHHAALKKAEQEKIKSNPFHKIPPELSYLEKKPPAPKPILPPKNVGVKKTRNLLRELGDLRQMAIKEISLQNKDTEINYNYPYIQLPMAAHQILVNVKHASLNSFDLAKVKRYSLNLSDTKIGLGYEFAGEITEVGSRYREDELLGYTVGAKVFGCVNPASRKGSLSTSLVIDPTKDVLIVVNDETLARIGDSDIELSFSVSQQDQTNFNVDSDSSDEVSVNQNPPVSSQGKEIPPLAKLTAVPVLYCRAKAILSHIDEVFEANKRATVIINGADTNLGFTLLQVLNSQHYSTILDSLRIVLVIRECNKTKISRLVLQFTTGRYYDPSKHKKIHVLPFDMVNDDIVLPGEKVPINYKKPEFFAAELLNILLGDCESSISKENVNDYLVDLFVDIYGSKKFFQLNIRFPKLSEIKMPYLCKIDSSETLQSLFKVESKSSLIMHILKPKLLKACFVSCCNFDISKSSHSGDDLFERFNSDLSWLSWSSKWSANLANSFYSYLYYDEKALRIKKEWVLDALNLVLDGELKFRIDEYLDWRNNFKRFIALLRKEDGKLIFDIEDF